MHIAHPPGHSRLARRQQGAVLVIGLIILVLLTLIGITTMRTTALEERMASHSTDRNMAMQSAEAAMRAAESYINGAVIGPFNNSNGLYSPRLPNPTTCPGLCKPWWELSTTWSNSANYRVYPGTMTNMPVSQLPRFIIEDVSASVSCTTSGLGTPVPNCQWQQTTTGKSVKDGGQIVDTGLYRVTARGVGGQTDAAGNPVTVVMLQSTFRR
jgi:type IV pilus assembly protein PilX